MLKYAKIINEETKACEVGLGTNSAFYQSIGMIEMEVEQAYDGSWYAAGFAPEKPEPTYEEVSETRRGLYIEKVDPITAQIQRLRDEDVTTAELEAEIRALIEERKQIVAKIKEENPYPEEKAEFVEETETTGTIL